MSQKTIRTVGDFLSASRGPFSALIPWLRVILDRGAVGMCLSCLTKRVCVQLPRSADK